MDEVKGLTNNFHKLSTHPFKAPTLLPTDQNKGRKRTKSLSISQKIEQTPFTLPKPNLAAFHSTGVLRKARVEDSVTPETPIKLKRQINSIWSNRNGRNEFKSPVTPLHPEKRDIKLTPAILLKPPMCSSLIQSPCNQIPFQSTPSKNNRGLKEYLVGTPTKGLKRTLPHDADTSSESYLNCSPVQEIRTEVIPQPPYFPVNSGFCGESNTIEYASPESDSKDINMSNVSNQSPIVSSKVFFSRLVKDKKVYKTMFI